jgi:hypothetical protein
MIPSLAVYASDTTTGSVTSWSLQSLTTGTTVAASSFDEVIEFGYLSSRIVGLVPSDENRLLVHDSVAGGMYVLRIRRRSDKVRQLRTNFTCS